MKKHWYEGKIHLKQEGEADTAFCGKKHVRCDDLPEVDCKPCLASFNKRGAEMTKEEYEIISHDGRKHYWIPDKFYIGPEPR
jgi:hypothetical protein